MTSTIPLDLLLSFISRHVACHFVWWLSKYLHGHGEKLFDVCTQRSRLLINKTTDQTNDSTLCIQSISSWGLRRGWGGRSGGARWMWPFQNYQFFLKTINLIAWEELCIRCIGILKLKYPVFWIFCYHMILVYGFF